jgi:hypothetical protein
MNAHRAIEKGKSGRITQAQRESAMMLIDSGDATIDVLCDAWDATRDEVCAAMRGLEEENQAVALWSTEGQRRKIGWRKQDLRSVLISLLADRPACSSDLAAASCEDKDKIVECLRTLRSEGKVHQVSEAGTPVLRWAIRADPAQTEIHSVPSFPIGLVRLTRQQQKIVDALQKGPLTRRQISERVSGIRNSGTCTMNLRTLEQKKVVWVFRHNNDPALYTLCSSYDREVIAYSQRSAPF